MPRERRCRLYWISEQTLWDLFFHSWQVPSYLRLHFFADLPVNCEVVNVWHSPERKVFVFVLYHASFDIVPDGLEPPCEQQLRYETVTLIKGTAPDGEPGFDLVTPLRAAVAVSRIEVERLRGIFSDLCHDSARCRLAYEQGRTEEREACADWLNLNACQETTDRVADALNGAVWHIRRGYHLKEPTNDTAHHPPG